MTNKENRMDTPQLYGKDKKGGIKTWTISVDGSIITVEHGKLGGKMTSKVSPPCKGKNIGKANETSPEQQALAEAQSKWQKQVDKGYGEDKDQLPENTLPPLAKKYQDVLPEISEDSPWYASVKMDGVRCTVFMRNGEVFFQSRGGKAYTVIKEISDELSMLFFKANPQLVVDGELYKHGMFLEDIISAVKKHNENTSKLNFYVFDVHNPDIEMPLQRRVAYHGYILSEGNSSRVVPVQQRVITSEKVLFNIHKSEVARGYEGVVLRDPKSLFKFNFRTAEFLKYKVAMSEEFEVAGSELDKNGGGVPVCYLKGMKGIADAFFEKNGKWGKADDGVFRANMKGTHEHRKELRKKLGDKTEEALHMTVEFEAYSKYGVPSKPIGQSFRDLDEDGNVET